MRVDTSGQSFFQISNKSSRCCITGSGQGMIRNGFTFSDAMRAGKIKLQVKEIQASEKKEQFAINVHGRRTLSPCIWQKMYRLFARPATDIHNTEKIPKKIGQWFPAQETKKESCLKSCFVQFSTSLNRKSCSYMRCRSLNRLLRQLLSEFYFCRITTTQY